MENNIPTLYILELDNSAVKSAKISTILSSFVQLNTQNGQILQPEDIYSSILKIVKFKYAK